MKYLCPRDVRRGEMEEKMEQLENSKNIDCFSFFAKKKIKRNVLLDVLKGLSIICIVVRNVSL